MTTLDLGRNRLGAEGAQALAAALTKNFILIELRLGWDEGRQVVAPYLDRNQAWLQQAFDQGLKYCLTEKPIVGETIERFSILTAKDLCLLKAHPQWVQDHLNGPLVSSFWRQLEDYRLQYWPQLKGWWKTATDSWWAWLPVEIQQHILSYLGPIDWHPAHPPPLIGDHDSDDGVF